MVGTQDDIDQNKILFCIYFYILGEPSFSKEGGGGGGDRYYKIIKVPLGPRNDDTP